MQKVRDCGVFSSRRNIYPLSQCSDTVFEEGMEGVQEPDIPSKIVFYMHDRPVAHIELMLGLHAQHLHKIKPAKIQTWLGKEFMSAHPYLRRY